MIRPASLPDFENPPLNEVVLGIQFTPIPGYQQIHAGEVWKLYQSKFPVVQEHPALPPTLENFGFRPTSMEFGFMSGATHDRFWFLNPSHDELIQYQPDKFLHNWRKVGTEENVYPRFEAIISKYSQELATLENYFKTSFSAPGISVNQCEVAYINYIYMEDTKGLALNDIFSFLKYDNLPDEFSCNFSRYLRNSEGQPHGRITCTVAQALGQRGPMYTMSLSVKGYPGGPSIAEALKFISNGREAIVHLFKELTGPKVHKLWGIK